MPKLLVCFKCKEGIYLYDNNPIRVHTESYFKSRHSGHPCQVINEDEIEPGYKIMTEENFRRKTTIKMFA